MIPAPSPWRLLALTSVTVFGPACFEAVAGDGDEADATTMSTMADSSTGFPSTSSSSSLSSTTSTSGAGPICGNNLTEAPEECDDGNLIDQDQCRADCTSARCGDGVTAIGWEICDDGNTDNTDECTDDCHLPRCGDGYVYAAEEDCDDGNREDGDGCPSSCVFGESTSTGDSSETSEGAGGDLESSGIMADASTGEDEPPHLCPLIDFFGEPEVLVTSAVDHLLVSEDGLSAIFSRYNDVPDMRRFYREFRSSSRGGFEVPTSEDFSFSRLDDTGADGWGFIHITSMTTDGLTLYTLTEGGGNYRIYSAERETSTGEFMSPEPVDLGRDGRFPYARVSGDGERLYAAGGSADDGLFVSRAGDTGFETMDQILEALVYRFALSPNELLVLYSEYPSVEDNSLWISQRSSVDEEFGRPVALDEFSSEMRGGSPLWISDDGCEIFFYAASDIFVAYKQ